MEDADYKFVGDMAATGVPVGVCSQIPRLRPSMTRRLPMKKVGRSDGRRMSSTP